MNLGAPGSWRYLRSPRKFSPGPLTARHAWWSNAGKPLPTLHFRWRGNEGVASVCGGGFRRFAMRTMLSPDSSRFAGFENCESACLIRRWRIRTIARGIDDAAFTGSTACYQLFGLV